MKCKYLIGIALSSCLAVPAMAADTAVKAPVKAVAPIAYWTFEVGGRYWYSNGRNRFDYYGGPTTASPIVSALNYDSTKGHTGEVFFRVDSPVGIFIKGNAGGGMLVSGTLYDEDFPPKFNPTSRTASDIRGDLSYATIDAGYSFYDGRKSGGVPVRLGAFVGYNYWSETDNAFGCRQINANPNVCFGPNIIPTSDRVIMEQDKWNSFRAGGVVDWWLTQQLKFTGEAAFISARQSAQDTHYFTFGPDPASGSGYGFQTEALLDYAVTNNFSVGVGGRWWHLRTGANDIFDQHLEYTTDRYGGFLQASYKFNSGN